MIAIFHFYPPCWLPYIGPVVGVKFGDFAWKIYTGRKIFCLYFFVITFFTSTLHNFDSGCLRTNNNHICGVMVSVLAQSVVYRSWVRAPVVLNLRLLNWYLLFFHWACSIKEQGQRPVGSGSGKCVRVERNVYCYCSAQLTL